MASALPGSICVGQHSVCIIRAAVLDDDCSPLGGADSGFVTTGIITATASPELLEGQTIEQVDGCGGIAWTVDLPDKIRKYTVSGELAFFDHELMQILFGGSIVVGGGGSDFSGDSIGWSAPNYTEAAPAAVYVEFITKTVGAGVGECSTSGNPFPVAVGHIFGKSRFVPGDRTFAADAATVSFTGSNVANPNLGTGPWGDYPGTGNIATSPYIQVSYSQAEYDAIESLAACGYQSTTGGGS